MNWLSRLDRFLRDQTTQTWIALACLLISVAGVGYLLHPDLPCRPPLFLETRTPYIDDYPRFLAEHNPLLSCTTVGITLIPLLVITGIMLLVWPGRDRRRVTALLALTVGVMVLG